MRDRKMAKPNVDWVEISVHPHGLVHADGEIVDGAGFPDSYSAALAAVAGRAKLMGAPVMVRSVDHIQGTESWFTVNDLAQTEIAEAPASPVPEIPVLGPPQPSTPPAAARIIDSVPAATGFLPEPQLAQPQTGLASMFAAVPVPINIGNATISDSPERFDVAEIHYVRTVRERPQSGIRRALFSATGGAVNIGKNGREREEAELIRRISRPLAGTFNTAVLSLKGGIGKTSTTAGVGMILAAYRGDSPCAVDANPDSGDLAERALGVSLYHNDIPRTISDIVRDESSIDSLTVLSRYMHRANRLHVMAGEQDPALSDALTAADYLKIQSLIAKYYSVVLTDCGTGVSHPAMAGILSTSTNLVIASSYAVSGAKRAKATIKWLAGHGYEHLARNSIVVITDKDQVSSRVNRKAIEENLAGHCKTLITVPHDRGVADGDQITLERVARKTRLAYMEIAAAIVDGYK